MKAKKLSLLSFLFILLLSSCATAITNAPYDVTEYEISSPNLESQIEFIGFKADTTNLSTKSEVINKNGKIDIIPSAYDQWNDIKKSIELNNFFHELTNKNILTDNSLSYSGLYSTYELEKYETNKRYISYIDVKENNYTYEDNGYEKNMSVMGTFMCLGSSITSFGVSSVFDDSMKTYCTLIGVGGLITGIINFARAITPSKTKLLFKGKYNIVIFDTLLKKIIYQDEIKLDCNDEFQGSITDKDTDKSIISNFLTEKLIYEIEKKYDKINQWLLSIQ